MKKLGWLIFLTAFNLSAQTVINNTPLDMAPEAGREMAEDVPVGTLVPATIDPVDGQLKLGEKKSVDNLSAPEPAKTDSPKMETAKTEADVAITPRAAEEVKLVEPARYYPPQKYIQFSFGYLNSKWEKADPSLDNGSTLTNFRMVTDMDQHNQGGFAVEIIQDTSSQTSPDNVRAIQYKLFIDHHRTIFEDKLDWVAGLAWSMGDYSIRKLTLNADDEEVNTKIKRGTLLGIIPSAGIRYYLGGRNSLDIGVEYHIYLSKPQSYIGGLAFVPRVSFVF
ncbi:MAG: hypothetical protein WC635_05360 [Bacteriovorax sp.]|jgi:hypothetical protein